jgi:predicted aspartyl protease
MKFPVCLALLLVPGLASASSPTALSFGLTPQGAIIVPIIINGSEPVSFLLDTGSNGSVISEQLASALGVEAVARTMMMSASGQKQALVARIERLTLGSVSVDSVLATIVSTGDLKLADVVAAGHVVQGVIGQDVLGRLRYTIDYRLHQIRWRDAWAGAPPHASRFELERQDDRFLIHLPQADRELRLVPDSGTEALVLFNEAGRVADSTATGGAIGLTGLAGTRAAQSAIVRVLRVGATRLIDVPAVIVRREPGSSVDGLLPLHLFGCVTFDGPERQLFIEPR